MMLRYPLLAIAVFCLSPLVAQLTVLAQFDPSNTGSTCGVAYNSVAGEVLVIECNGATIDRYSQAGAYLGSAPIAGESANDVDVDMSPVALTMNGTTVAQGQLLFMNGETDQVDIYAIDEVSLTVIDTLETAFGVSHVVGGSYHPARQTFFVIQDKVPGGFQANRVAEIDPATGDTLQTFSVAGNFEVNYGDLDISPVSGHLFIVSSDESGIAEFTPDGLLVAEHPLPVGVSGLSGIALDNDLQGAWVCSTGGVVSKLGNFPIGMAEVGAGRPFSIAPNPADGSVTILFAQSGGPGASLSLLDATGRVVKRWAAALMAASGPTVLDLHDVVPGGYILSLVDGAARSAQRLMVEQ